MRPMTTSPTVLFIAQNFSNLVVTDDTRYRINLDDVRTLARAYMDLHSAHQDKTAGLSSLSSLAEMVPLQPWEQPPAEVREVALEHALKLVMTGNYTDRSPGVVLEIAKRFEDYLKGASADAELVRKL
jgi:hypothetical protein